MIDTARVPSFICIFRSSEITKRNREPTMAANVLTRAVRLTGTNVREPKRRILSAGPITAMFDNGALRCIRHGDK